MYLLGEFRCDILVPEELQDYRIIKFVLQPLVENAIFHGVEPADHFCKIVISAAAENGVLHLVVEDNGVGMDEQRLAVLNGQVESADKSGIGATNVRSRIKLVYGEKLHSGARGGAPDPERCQRGGAHFPKLFVLPVYAPAFGWLCGLRESDENETGLRAAGNGRPSDL